MSGGGVSQPNHCIGLRALLTLHDVEFHIVPFFQGFVAVQLDRRVMYEYIGSIIVPNESIALGIIEPLYFSFVLSHSRLPFLAS